AVRRPGWDLDAPAVTPGDLSPLLEEGQADMQALAKVAAFGGEAVAVLTQPPPAELAGALAAVATARGDTGRSRTRLHGAIHVEMDEHHRDATMHGDLALNDPKGRHAGTPVGDEGALDRFAIEVEQFASACVAERVEAI